MSRYYIYDSVTDKVAEFARGMTPGMLGKLAGNTAKKAQSGIRGRVALGLGGLAAAGGATYGGYKLATRGKKAKEAPVDTSIKGRIKAQLAAAKSTASSGASKVKAGVKKGTAAARNRYNKMRGRQEA